MTKHHESTGVVVMKFGGSSVADIGCVRLAARRMVAAYREGQQVVGVVSAMASTTDQLVRLARGVLARPPARELDLLLSTGECVSAAIVAMAVQQLGVPACALTGGQAGIRTGTSFGAARVRDVRPDRVLTATEAGIAVVAGFQGVSDQGDVTTLGRGGSDATAVVLAHALAADRCEIYTDVDGVYAADPRVVPHANRLARLSHHNMLRMADAGARIVQPHAARLARDLRVPLHVRSTFSDREGTVIDAAAGAVPTDVILGIAHVRQAAPDRLPKLGRITILGAGASMGPAPHSLALAALRSGGLRVWATQVDAGGGVHVWTTRGDADKLVIFVDQAETDDAVRLLYDTLVAAPERESNVTFMP